MTENALNRIENRLKHEKQMSTKQVDMVLAVIEQELTGTTTRPTNYKMTETGAVRQQ